ncbi:MAG: amidohydrolase family protein [Alphaproteobacteria bacterium]|jgi:predicted TIM-barrel fold metal-dependent hydrolase|nr:amidohydrolase family protein [Rhodospirillaceae bacterium]MBT6509944.1 amidohydrolase family protein [Rhodospirillaceae bacterium]MBT7646688.1 amidohydrolase family protein [Rhodospirillaceae bacterium]MDG2483124.1 amidohydrolase family protein [Alphaproteobacteria bacterium]
MSDVLHDVVISGDAHVGEPDGMRAYMPKEHLELLPKLERSDDGNFKMTRDGDELDRAPKKEPGPIDLMKEFREDPSQGTNHDLRLEHMALQGVDAAVLFPNIGLSVSMGNSSPAFNHAWARAHNEFTWDTFSEHRHRLKPAAVLAIDDLDAMLAEAERCIKLGFCTLFLPATVPWRPYRLPVYEPLWSLAEEAGVPINFHIFSGNLALRGDMVSVADLSDDRIEALRGLDELEKGGPELINITVMGMAAGMSPLAEVIGSGVLEAHPDLKVVVTESECGWLAWFLHAMDQMNRQRHLGMKKLELEPSEYFHRQCNVTITDDPVALHNVPLTGSDCLLWGDDYPHDEGVFPDGARAIREIRDALTPQASHHVLCGNAAKLYGFDLDLLQATRDEVMRFAA